MNKYANDYWLLVFMIILLIWEFFTPALIGSFPLETEWQQVSSSLFKSPGLFLALWPILTML